MDNASMGRSLFFKQLCLSALILALGGYACVSVYGLRSLPGELSGSDRQALTAVIAAAQSLALHILIATLVAAASVIATSVLVIQRSVVQPLRNTAEVIDRLAAGDHAARVDGDDHSGEIGRIARGLRAIRDVLATREAQPAALVPGEATDARVRVLSNRLDRFSLDLASQVRRLGAMTKRLADAAHQMTAAAKHANEGSDQATTASANAAGDVSSVATASEQLLDSIEEISRQVVQSTNVVRAAVERAVETNTGMGRLSAAAQKVGDVVSLISRIAAQTNLLALNATIEAARAGEAGRGFAVVAQEVKTLATQTAKATQDITGQIAEMQEATDLSVDAIDKIQTKIAEVEHISTIIASAVHEQGAATQEIARNVRSAAAGTATMSSQIENVVRSIGETSASAASISTLARELDEIAMGMTDMVDTFSQSFKAA